jgi:hypothetical protein
MKRTIFTLLILLFLSGFLYGRDDMLKVPLTDDSQIISEKEGKLVFTTGLSHDEALAFYKETFKGLKDINYRDWKNATYIEDDSNRPWHSVLISKNMEEQKTKIVVSQDSWSWIVGTLILRFIGVFIVLLILYIGLTLSGQIISRVVNRSAAKAVAK